MVQSKAATVDEYLSQVSPKRQSYLRQVRDLAARVLVDHEERMQWGMPVYVRNGRVRFGFAEQKQFVSLYFMEPRVLDENAAALADITRGKSCLRFRRPERIDLGLVETLLSNARSDRGAQPPEGAQGGAAARQRP
jgi:uncharacterized protein YdhG (YjbR/CyaY superfamily)